MHADPRTLTLNPELKSTLIWSMLRPRAGNTHGAENMSGEGAHTRIAVPIAASLAEFTDKLIARRGVEQSNLLFGGQIGPATQALSGRTNVISVGDLAPDFSLPTAKATTWSLAKHIAERKYSS